MADDMPVVRPDVRDSPTCMNAKCGKSFGIMRHRYPCRACGKTFCNTCTSRTIPLPPMYGYGNTPQRACGDCYFALAEMHRVNEGGEVSVRDQFAGLEAETKEKVRDFVNKHAPLWRTKTEGKGVKISSASVEDSEFHSVRTETTIARAPEDVLRIYTTKELWSHWNPELVECRTIEEVSPAEEVIYAAYKVAVVQNRDACLFSVTRPGLIMPEASLEPPQRSFHILACSFDHPLAEVGDKFIRSKVHLSYSTFSPVDAGGGEVHTKYESITHVEPGGKVPAQIVNATISRAVEQMAAMREYMEAASPGTGSAKVLDAVLEFAASKKE